MIENSVLQSYLTYKDEIDEAVNRTLNSGSYILGREVETFEQSFASYIGVKYAIGVGNGTDAIQIALIAAGVKPGDEVITVSHTAVATVAAIALTGATPVLVDIDSQTFTMDPDQLADAITKETKAVVPVHLYGHPADIYAISDICQDNELILIEDCAQSHGSKINGKKTGTFGDINAFSFYPTKNLGAFGDGGAVVTDDPDLASRCRAIRQYGWVERNNSQMPGSNSRLDEIQAAILSVKLAHLDKENDKRREAANQYNRQLKGITIPREKKDYYHVYHQYVVKVKERDRLRQYLNSLNILTQIHYPTPVHKQNGYENLIKTVGSLKCTEETCTRILSLPMHPWLSSVDIDHITGAINKLTLL